MDGMLCEIYDNTCSDISDDCANEIVDSDSYSYLLSSVPFTIVKVHNS
jgi:hypothetical protein